jgi:methylase of polypeptide subunit release factors
MYQLMLDGKLITAPIPKEQQLHRVLDLGTGTGIWAMDFGMRILLLGDLKY